jgi:His-Xaa-Ser system radical SAM maturase HxsC
MLRLHARLKRQWDAEPFVARISTRSELPEPLRHSEALLTVDPLADATGFRAAFRHAMQGEASADENAESPLIILPPELSYVTDGDIIRVVPRAGELTVLYRRESKSNSLLATDQCNSNCLMCSQPPKPHDDSYLIDVWLEAIPLMDRSTHELGITGGEPTLRGDSFLRLVSACKQHLPETSLHVLSNGRLFRYLQYANDLGSISHPDLMIGIPLYSDLPHRHDFVVQAKGAFDQTLRGILNLKRCGVRVELRVVIHRQTVERLPRLAKFIATNLFFVDHVALMGLEIMGYVKMNMDALWIDPVDYQPQLVEAVEALTERRLNVSIYNHQLCVLPRSLWPYARKSISDWKNEYFEPCQECSVRAECGGFFSSSHIRHSDHIRAIIADQGALLA